MTQQRKPRQHRTARERAEMALAVATRVAERTEGKVKRLRLELREAEAEHRDAARRRDFLAGSPDLTTEDDTPLPTDPEQHPTTEEE